MTFDPSFLADTVFKYGGVRRPWIEDKSDPLFKQYGYNTGIDIYCYSVYSYANGVVLAVGQDTDGYYSVTVQYDANSCLRYTHLLSHDVQAGDIVQAGFVIGAVHKYFRFEYVTKDKGTSLWPVRVGTETYYKQDPVKMFGVD